MATTSSLRGIASGVAALALGLTGVTAAIAPAQAAPPTTPGENAPAQDDLPTLTYDDVAEWAEILVDGEDVERDADGAPFNTFGGFGAVSANNTSNLLMDYKEERPEVYWRVMNLLFNPDSGAGLNHIKIELGGDANTSSGTEPATKRTAEESANVLRGAGFHFTADALSINPDIKVEALRWAEPSWTGNGYAERFQWYRETIDAAYDTFGITFDYVSPSQNEVATAYMPAELEWTVDFAQRLEQAAQADDARYDYSEIKIVALDSYRNVGRVASLILDSEEALEQIDAIGYHYDIAGDPGLTRLNKEYGMEVLYSEGVSPMIEPEYRLNGQPEMGGIGGTVGAVDIADRFINAYRWEGSIENPGHMTSFLFQPAVSAMYEGSQYLPKSLIRTSDPWSGTYEGDIGVVLVRHFMQFIDHGWEYIEGASLGNGTKGDGGTVVDTSTRTYLTLRTPQAEVAEGESPEWTQVHANNTDDVRNFEVKVANLGGAADRPLYVWETTGPQEGEAYDAGYLQNPGKVVPVRTETIDGVEHQVYQVQIAPYSMQTLSTMPRGLSGNVEEYSAGQYAPQASDVPLELPYTDDFSYAEYGEENINGVSMDYVERRGGNPRYTADQHGAFEVVDSGDAEHGNVMQQQIHGDIRPFTWNPWGDGSMNQLAGSTPVTVLGDHNWTNYTASVDFRLDEVRRDADLENFAGLGVRQVVARGSDYATYSARVYEDGRWELRKLDAVVESGTLFMYDPAQWRTLAIEAREHVLTLTLDGEELTTWADTSSNPVMSGRISLVSGYSNTQFDNLAIEPIEDHSWHAVKIDDADSRISYPQGASFRQVGYAHLNRTQHVVGTGQSVAFEAEGTGFNLNGASGSATLEIQVDDDPLRTAQVGGTGDRQTLYWLRGLDEETHQVTVSVTSGTLTLDGVDVVVGGQSGSEVDPSEKPVSVQDTLPRLAVGVGQAPQLPETLTATSEAGGSIEAEITWDADPARFTTPYEMVKVDGTFTNNPLLTVSAYVEVVPSGTQYFIDANAQASGERAVAYPAIAAQAAAEGEGLLNEAPDGLYSAETGWGAGGSYSAKGVLNIDPYDKTRESGRYTSGASTPLTYLFTLPAGDYVIASGHTEWWNPGSGRSRSMEMSIEVPDGAGGTTAVPVGSASFPHGSSGQRAVVTAEFTMPVDGEVVYTVDGSAGTEAPALSWVGIHEAAEELADKAALEALVAEAADTPKRAYTAESWNALRDVAVAARAVLQDATATQAEVDAAAADLQAALDALEEVPYLPLEEYRVAVSVGETVDLPETLTFTTISGEPGEVPVTWGNVPSTDEAYSQVQVQGLVGSTSVSLWVNVIPEDLTYYVDAAAFEGENIDNLGKDSPVHGAVVDLLGDDLRNQEPDAVFSEDEQWGLTTPLDNGATYVRAKSPVAGDYSPFRTTGWWAGGAADASIDYRFWLEPGAYEVTVGYQEWWGVTRYVTPSITVDGETTDGDEVALSGGNPQQTETIEFEVAEAGYVDLSTWMSTGTSQPVMSWAGVNRVGDVVEEPVLAMLTVEAPPETVSYEVGEDLDLSGLQVSATYSDGSTRAVASEELEVSGFDSSTPGTQEVTLTLSEGEATASASFTVTITEPATPEASFSDVPEDNLFFAEIEWLASQGISTGWKMPDESSEFRPLSPINRDAMAAFLYRMADVEDYTAPAVSPFVDVSTSNQFYTEIAWLYEEGISTGWSTAAGREFRPLQPIARDAMAAFLYRMAEEPQFTAPATSVFADVSESNQFYTEISWMHATGIATGWDGSGNDGRNLYRPLNNVNRDAMAAFLFRYAHQG